MQVHDIEIADCQAQFPREISRIIEPSQPPRTKIMDSNAVKVDGMVVRDTAVSRAIYTGGKHLNLMAPSNERLAQGMYRVNGTAISNGWVIAWNDVQDPHYCIDLIIFASLTR